MKVNGKTLRRLSRRLSPEATLEPDADALEPDADALEPAGWSSLPQIFALKPCLPLVALLLMAFMAFMVWLAFMAFMASLVFVVFIAAFMAPFMARSINDASQRQDALAKNKHKWLEHTILQ